MGKHDSSDSSHIGHHNETDRSGDRAAENLKKENKAQQTRFTVPPSQLLLIIQSLQGFEWLRP